MPAMAPAPATPEEWLRTFEAAVRSRDFAGGRTMFAEDAVTFGTWARAVAGLDNGYDQAHPTGYPLYRLEWQALGSLQRRLRNCLVGMRAEPYDYGAPEFVELELYLMWRARGMNFEAPAVRP